MKSKRLKKKAKARTLGNTTLRNTVAANPLLGKSGCHTDVRASGKLSRSKSRRDLQKARKSWRDDMGQGGKDNWQNDVSVAIETCDLETSFCQLSFPQIAVAQTTTCRTTTVSVALVGCTA